MHFTSSANIHELFRANWIVCKEGKIFNLSQFSQYLKKHTKFAKSYILESQDWLEEKSSKKGCIGEKGM